MTEAIEKGVLNEKVGLLWSLVTTNIIPHLQNKIKLSFVTNRATNQLSPTASNNYQLSTK